MIGDVYNPTGEASYVSYSADGKWLAIVGILGQARLWNTTTERFVKGTIVSLKGRMSRVATRRQLPWMRPRSAVTRKQSP